MIRAIIHDISDIVEKLREKHPFEQLVYHLDADVKFYLFDAFADDRIYDFDVSISQGTDLIHLKVKIKEEHDDDWDHLGWSIDRPEGVKKVDLDAYNRAMSGI